MKSRLLDVSQILAAHAVAPAKRTSMRPLALSAAVDLAAVAVVIAGRGTSLALASAAALHAAAAVLLALDETVVGSRRALIVAFALSLPVVGTALAALALLTTGRAELAEADPHLEHQAPRLDREEIRQLADALPACDVLMTGAGSGRIYAAPATATATATGTAAAGKAPRSGGAADLDSAEERRALLAALTKRADAGAVTLLRWLTASSPDMGVEAALALEELGANFELELDRRRAALRDAPDAAAYVAAAKHIARGLASGIVEPVLTATLFDEARGYFQRATSKSGGTKSDIALAWAELELLAMRPEAAARLIEEGLAVSGTRAVHAQLTSLREQAALARHEPLWDDGGPPISVVSSYAAMPS